MLYPQTEDKVLPEFNKQIIKSLSYLLVENERSARRFISSLHLGIDISSLQLFVLDKNTTLEEVATYFDKIPDNEDIGILSEAGCPGIADPGAVAVFLAHKEHREVVPLVGPSSILMALVGSGFSGQVFTFHGYLPVKAYERGKVLRQLEKETLQKGVTNIFMETPYRNDALLSDLLDCCNGETWLCIASEISAPGQMIVSRKLRDWKKNKPVLHKKPTVFLFGKPQR
ncbi:SAM-dependent methyltransferase [Cytophagaceae bacterium ABcell3]|nr:SAM-dependent methyltransferase [Cytophagaceae bacterium ABcell3]